MNKYRFSIFNYIITSNHIHLLLLDNGRECIARGMQYSEGKSAQEINKNINRIGSLWSDRYHATIIDSGIHLIKYMIYIDLNRVRAGVVRHPLGWPDSGYHELTQGKHRYRFIDFKALKEYTGFDRDWWRKTYPILVKEELYRKSLRDPVWTESVVVGRDQFIKKLKSIYTKPNLNVSNASIDEGIALSNS